MQRALMAIDLKAIKERWPITDEQRLEMVEKAMDVLQNSKSPRTRLMAIRILGALDQINVQDKKIGTQSEPRQHIHHHALAEPSAKVIEAQANLVAALSEMSHATKPSEIVGELAEGI